MRTLQKYNTQLHALLKKLDKNFFQLSQKIL
jgi:hypothetical protein